MDCLIIKEHWLNKILNGEKTWELRGSNTTKRGTIAFIQKGSGKIFGTCELVDVVGPLSVNDLKANLDKHQVPKDDLKNVTQHYKKPHAWVMRDAKRLSEPKPYKHPSGAVIWVKLKKIDL